MINETGSDPHDFESMYVQAKILMRRGAEMIVIGHGAVQKGIWSYRGKSGRRGWDCSGRKQKEKTWGGACKNDYIGSCY